MWRFRWMVYVFDTVNSFLGRFFSSSVAGIISLTIFIGGLLLFAVLAGILLRFLKDFFQFK